MVQTEFEITAVDQEQESIRLAALVSTGILDTEPEPCYDAITRLAAEYFRADTVLLGFGDESRVWIKSHWGEAIRELPRSKSIFDMVLAADSPVIVSDVSEHADFKGSPLRRRLSGRQDSGVVDHLRQSAPLCHGPG
jgi:hypothetical protein